MVRVCAVLLLAGVGSAGLSAQAPAPGRPDLDHSIPAAMPALGAVGVSAAVVANGRIAWTGAFGLADRERHLPLTPFTPVMLASASKLFTGAALLRLREDVGFGLDDDVSRYLPFVLRNPAYPDRPITFRMLLVHTSSIADNPELRPLYGYGDSSMSLEELVTSYFSPGGSRFGKSFHEWAPGDRYTYTNTSFALLGYLVERMAGTDFESYCRRTLFAPLQLRQTSWFLHNLDSTQVARHYEAGGAPGEWRPVGHYGWPGYPDGQLRASATDVAQFLLMLLDGGTYRGTRVLRPETVELMFARQHVPGLTSPFLPTVDLALPWHINRLGEREIYLHTGRGSGIATAVWLDRHARTGGVLLITGAITDRDGFIALIRQVADAGDGYAQAH